MKGLLKRILFGANGPKKILTGVSAGMLVNYDPKNRSLHLLGLYEREIYKYFKRGVKIADTLIDIGANDGYYALAFAKKDGKKIILCEPSAVKEDLRKNLVLNGLVEGKDFKIIDKFVGERTTKNEVSIIDLIGDSMNVFVLMDVDGAEQQILEKWNFSSDSKVNWLIETHSLLLEERISELFRQHDYKVVIIPNAWWRKFIPERRPLEHNRWMYASKNP
jgi:hypothetical protein